MMGVDINDGVEAIIKFIDGNGRLSLCFEDTNCPVSFEDQKALFDALIRNRHK